MRVLTGGYGPAHDATRIRVGPPTAQRLRRTPQILCRTDQCPGLRRIMLTGLGLQPDRPILELLGISYSTFHHSSPRGNQEQNSVHII